MKGIENYIFMSICEESFKFFGTTKFVTYTNFCMDFHFAMLDGKFSFSQRQLMGQLGKMLEKLYAMNNDEIGFYINAYFSLDVQQLANFQKVVRGMHAFYPMSFN